MKKEEENLITVFSMKLKKEKNELKRKLKNEYEREKDE